MRTCIDGNGDDSTTAVRAHLAAHKQLVCADLIQFKTPVQGESWSQVFNITPYDKPLTWAPRGTFRSAVVKRDTIESVIGLDTQSCVVQLDLADDDLFGYYRSSTGAPNPVSATDDFNRSAVVCTDDFNRADGLLADPWVNLTSSPGPFNWTNVAGITTLCVRSNQLSLSAYSGNGGDRQGAAYRSDITNPDQYAALTYISGYDNDWDNGFVVMVRYTETEHGGSFYYIRIHGANQVNWGKVIDGVVTQVGYKTYSSGVKLGISVQRSTVTVSIDDAIPTPTGGVATWTDTAISSGNPGVVLSVGDGFGATHFTADNFDAGEILAPDLGTNWTAPGWSVVDGQAQGSAALNTVVTVNGKSRPWLSAGTNPTNFPVSYLSAGSNPVSVLVTAGQKIALSYVSGTTGTRPNIPTNGTSGGVGSTGATWNVAPMACDPGGTIEVKCNYSPSGGQSASASITLSNGTVVPITPRIAGNYPTVATFSMAVPDGVTSVSGSMIFTAIGSSNYGEFTISSTSPHTDCRGEVGVVSSVSSPGHYASETANRGCLLASFADAAGNVIEVHAPGNGATLTAPVGATQLLLGTNNDSGSGYNNYANNYGSWSVRVKDVTTALCNTVIADNPSAQATLVSLADGEWFTVALIDASGNEYSFAVRKGSTPSWIFTALGGTTQTGTLGAPLSADTLRLTVIDGLATGYVKNIPIASTSCTPAVNVKAGFRATAAATVDNFIAGGFDGPDAVVTTRSITLLQSFVASLWDQGDAHIWRTVMPTDGDCNTLGAMEMFGGYIADIKPTRTGVEITINSLTERLDQKVPTNLIQAGNPKAEYGLGSAPAGLSEVPVFEVLAGSDAVHLVADCVTPEPTLFANDCFDFGYVQFTSGTTLGKIMRTVRRSKQVDGHNVFYFYEPLPWAPTEGETFAAYVPYARSQTTTVSERHTIPASDPYSIQVTNHLAYTSTVNVSYANGSSVLKFTPDGAGNYLFDASDAGKQVDITYTYHNGNATQGFPYVPTPEASI